MHQVHGGGLADHRVDARPPGSRRRRRRPTWTPDRRARSPDPSRSAARPRAPTPCRRLAGPRPPPPSPVPTTSSAARTTSPHDRVRGAWRPVAGRRSPLSSPVSGARWPRGLRGVSLFLVTVLTREPPSLVDDDRLTLANRDRRGARQARDLAQCAGGAEARPGARPVDLVEDRGARCRTCRRARTQRWSRTRASRWSAPPPACRAPTGVPRSDRSRWTRRPSPTRPGPAPPARGPRCCPRSPSCAIRRYWPGVIHSHVARLT